jgi:hypothetical protein
MTGLQRKDLYLLSFLFLVVLLIFYPVCFTDYIYTDEAVQLWLYRPGSGYNMYGPQGRWIPEIILSRFYESISTIHELTFMRVAALLIWLVCIPVWYVIIKRITAKGAGYEYLPFFTCLYLVTSLPFAVAIQWVTCMELSIANTAGLLSGAIWYLSIRDKEKLWSIPVGAALGAAAAGLLSLFAYQSGFGCFLIPFLFHYISAYTTRKDQVFIKGLAFYFLMYAVYFVLHKLVLNINHLGSDARAGFSFNPAEKIGFFFSQPLKRAFWFNLLVNDQHKLARALYKVLLVGWMLLAFIRFGKKNWLAAVKYIAAALVVFLLAYLPSLVVKENYSSNRTLAALNMCVWIACAEMVLYTVKNIQLRRVIAFSLAAVLLIGGWYNFNKQFLQPVHEEYVAVKDYVQQHYNKNITTVYFIKAAEDGFRTKYHIQSSMDEFGMPSTYPDWVPEPLTRQLVYEKTGNREIANQLSIKYWENAESFATSGEKVTENTLVVNVPEIINSNKP